MIRIKDWRQFQHYTDRNPPWIKLHHVLLDDREWFELDGDASKVLIMCWLIASENDGNLPNLTDLAFRFRMTEKRVSENLSKLSHWLEQDASAPLAERPHNAAPETEAETETDISIKNNWPGDYRDQFWKAYPRRVGKKAVFRKLGEIAQTGEIEFDALLQAVRSIETKEERFIPHPLTWLNQGRYLDGEVPSEPPPSSKPFFVAVDTEQWEGWSKVRKWPEKDFKVDGRYQRGWWFESEWPPDHKPQMEGAQNGAAPPN